MDGKRFAQNLMRAGVELPNLWVQAACSAYWSDLQRDVLWDCIRRGGALDYVPVHVNGQARALPGLYNPRYYGYASIVPFRVATRHACIERSMLNRYNGLYSVSIEGWA